MAALESQMIALDTPMPRFDLPDTVSGRIIRSDDFTNRPVLVMFICNHCPFVVHVRGDFPSWARTINPARWPWSPFPAMTRSRIRKMGRST